MRACLVNDELVIQNIDILHAENYSLFCKVQEVHLRTRSKHS